MNRRQLMWRMMSSTGLVLLSNACGLVQPQPQARIPRIGYLSAGPRETFAFLLDPFLEGLRNLGYIEGRTIIVEERFAAADSDAPWPALASELVGLSPDVIVVMASTPAALATRRATTTIPIVAANVTNPGQTGLVDTLAQRGGNFTALANTIPGIEGKYLQLLRDLVPDLARVVALLAVDNPALVANWETFQQVAVSTHVHAERVELRTADELEAAFATPAFADAQALVNFANPLLLPISTRVAELAIQHHLPSISGATAYARAGFLMTYSPDTPTIARRAAFYVDKLLKGAKPADLPVEQPTVFDFAVNVKTAQALGLSIPPDVAAQVTEWIE